MPYMVGYTNDVEKTLFLRRWVVPYWALACVFGRMGIITQFPSVFTSCKD
jgi:hypothetical protein